MQSGRSQCGALSVGSKGVNPQRQMTPNPSFPTFAEIPRTQSFGIAGRYSTWLGVVSDTGTVAVMVSTILTFPLQSERCGVETHSAAMAAV